MSGENKKTFVSGIQASGRLHIGNYFGAMKQFVAMQDDYNSNIFVANYHSLSTVQDGEQLKQQTWDVVLDYLAVGLDPEKVTLYTQTSVPQLFELTWIFNNLITVSYLTRAHAYKDKTAKGVEASVGLFDYPVLMAADILLTDADIVPVGQDQKQHVEITREIARKCNYTYGEVFKEPDEYIMDGTAVVPGTDGEKMSKSYGNTIPLFGSYDELKEAVMGIVTDSKAPEEPKDPEEDVIFKLHKLVTPETELAEIRKGYEEGGLGYGESKKKLLANFEEFIRPMREKREELAKDPEYVKNILADGGQKAHDRAEEIMKEVRNKAGLTL